MVNLENSRASRCSIIEKVYRLTFINSGDHTLENLVREHLIFSLKPFLNEHLDPTIFNKICKRHLNIFDREIEAEFILTELIHFCLDKLNKVFDTIGNYFEFHIENLTQYEFRVNRDLIHRCIDSILINAEVNEYITRSLFTSKDLNYRLEIEFLNQIVLLARKDFEQLNSNNITVFKNAIIFSKSKGEPFIKFNPIIEKLEKLLEDKLRFNSKNVNSLTSATEIKRFDHQYYLKDLETTIKFFGKTIHKNSKETLRLLLIDRLKDIETPLKVNTFNHFIHKIILLDSGSRILQNRIVHLSKKELFINSNQNPISKKNIDSGRSLIKTKYMVFNENHKQIEKDFKLFFKHQNIDYQLIEK